MRRSAWPRHQPPQRVRACRRATLVWKTATPCALVATQCGCPDTTMPPPVVTSSGVRRHGCLFRGSGRTGAIERRRRDPGGVLDCDACSFLGCHTGFLGDPAKSRAWDCRRRGNARAGSTRITIMPAPWSGIPFDWGHCRLVQVRRHEANQRPGRKKRYKGVATELLRTHHQKRL